MVEVCRFLPSCEEGSVSACGQVLDAEATVVEGQVDEGLECCGGWGFLDGCNCLVESVVHCVGDMVG